MIPERLVQYAMFLGLVGIMLPLPIALLGYMLGFPKFAESCLKIVAFVGFGWLFALIAAGLVIAFQVLILGTY